jgi:Spy/CpxP family protein refolding chaperone
MRRPTVNGKGKTLLLIISLAFNLGACLAVAVKGYGGPGPQREQDHERRHRGSLTEKLGLSPQQEEVLAASREAFFAELRPLKQEIHEEARVLAELITAVQLDMGAVSAQADRVAAARNEIHQRMVQHLLSVREVLEPDQLEAFKEWASRILSRSGRGRPHRDKPPHHDGRHGRP